MNRPHSRRQFLKASKVVWITGGIIGMSSRAAAAPDANFRYSPEWPMTGESVTFDASKSDGNIEKFSWRFTGPDYLAASGEKITIDFHTEGRYKATLEVTDLDGKTDTTSKWFIVGNEAPNVRFDVSDTSPTPGQKVTFDATASSDPDGHIDRYYWVFGNSEGPLGNRGGEKVTWTWEKTGEGYVQLRLADDLGRVATKTKDIEITKSTPTPTATPTRTPTVTPTVTPTRTPTESPTPTPSPTDTSVSTPTETPADAVASDQDTTPTPTTMAEAEGDGGQGMMGMLLVGVLGIGGASALWLRRGSSPDDDSEITATAYEATQAEDAIIHDEFHTLNRKVTDNLHEAGFETIQDLKQANKNELTTINGIDQSDARLIKAEIEDADVGISDISDSPTESSDASQDVDQTSQTQETSVSEQESDQSSEAKETAADIFQTNCEPIRSAYSLTETTTLHTYRVEMEENPVALLHTLAPEHGNDTNASEVFVQTVNKWNSISHNPHVTTVHDHGDKPRPWVAFDGGDLSLADAMDELSWDEYSTIVAGIFEALQTANLYNFSHGSISPNTIYLEENTEGTTVTLADWGLTPTVQKALNEFNATPYTAPEQLDANETPIGSYTDIYQTGAIIYELVTKQSPYDQASDLEQAIRTGNLTLPTQVADVSSTLDEVINTAMATNPDDRYQSPDEFKAALDRIFN